MLYKKLLIIISSLLLSISIISCGTSSSNKTPTTKEESTNTNNGSNKVTDTSDINNDATAVSGNKDNTDISGKQTVNNIYSDEITINNTLKIKYPTNWTSLSEADNSYLIDNTTVTNLVYKKIDSNDTSKFIASIKNDLSSYNVLGKIEEGTFLSKNKKSFTTLSFNTNKDDIKTYQKQYILTQNGYGYIFTISSSSANNLNNNLISFEDFINTIN